MALTQQDRSDITDLINLHGHFADAGDLDAMCELFTPDIIYDVHDFGFGELAGAAAIREATLALGQANPVGHHVTNIVINPIDDRSARVRSKGIGIKADGTTGSATYDDTVTRRPEGWRISRRTVTARRAALGAQVAQPREDDAGPHAVLDRLREATRTQSVEGMRSIYAVDAVHEFPFAFPGVPTRLEGRDEIVGWIEAQWQGGPLRLTGYRTHAVHTTTDPDTIVVEQDALGTNGTDEGITLPNLMVLTARNGQVVHVRDYVNVLAAAAALGVELGGPVPR
jgi:ketosteroid isomerase-like protein